ncbi:hypothetical protein ACSD7O_22240 [Methylorubrum extorquens]|uniref:hypothetical protein n=1 Tax=Methylorubrum extorquens TaxID=408 RepID=UPI003F5F3DED
MSRNKPRSPSAAGSDAGAERAGTSPAPGAAGAGGTGPVDPNPAGATGQGGTGATGAAEGATGPTFDPDLDARTLGGADLSGAGDDFGAEGHSGGLVSGVREEAQLRDYASRTIEGDASRPVAGAGVEAAATLAAARPQEAARVLDAAAGSATDAPSIGMGGLVDLAAREIPGAVAIGVPVAARLGEAAGVAPGLFDAGGSHGPVPEPLSRFGQTHPETRRMILAADLAERDYTGAKLAVPQPDSVAALADFQAAGFDLVVTSRQLNFRRAGVVHPTSPTLRRSEDFTEAELAMLINEPMLVVTALR